jgi:hypothetical protein
VKLTEAEKNHLLHIVKESLAVVKGPATTWCQEHGIEHRELAPLFEVLSGEIEAEGIRGRKPTAEWVPPAESAEAFRKRISELAPIVKRATTVTPESPEEREFALEWAREWFRGPTFLGSAREALKNLNISELDMFPLVASFHLGFEFELESAQAPPREVKSPWKSREEYEERSKLWKRE